MKRRTKHLKLTKLLLSLTLGITLFISVNNGAQAAICSHTNSTRRLFSSQINPCIRGYYEQRFCRDCGQEDPAILTSTSGSHSYGEWRFYQSYPTSDGHTVVIEISTCPNCNTSQTRSTRY